MNDLVKTEALQDCHWNMSVELREIVLIPWLEQFQMIILKGRKEGSKEKGWGEL